MSTVTYVAFVRAINVGGHAIVRMADLKKAFASAGCREVRKKSGFCGFQNNFVEKELGVSATTRKWSTVTKMVATVQKERTK